MHAQAMLIVGSVYDGQQTHLQLLKENDQGTLHVRHINC